MGPRRHWWDWDLPQSAQALGAELGGLPLLRFTGGGASAVGVVVVVVESESRAVMVAFLVVV